MADPTTFTPTAKNEAFADAAQLRRDLADAVRAGFDAGAVTEAGLAEATGQLVGEVNRILSATALDLEDVTHVVSGFDAAGFTAFQTAANTAIGALTPN